MQILKVHKTSKQNRKVEGFFKAKVMNEMNTHVQRQVKIDEIMRNRYDDKASKKMFGADVSVARPILKSEQKQSEELLEYT
jgi:hypothetical protein